MMAVLTAAALLLAIPATAAQNLDQIQSEIDAVFERQSKMAALIEAERGHLRARERELERLAGEIDKLATHAMELLQKMRRLRNEAATKLNAGPVM